MKKWVTKVRDVASHRNGVSGVPFHVVRFVDGGRREMIATVFPEKGACAVLRMDLLAEDNIAFGENSWHGDGYDEELRAAIAAWEEART